MTTTQYRQGDLNSIQFNSIPNEGCPYAVCIKELVHLFLVLATKNLELEFFLKFMNSTVRAERVAILFGGVGALQSDHT